jgi:ATP-dependent DNA helicase DinG
MDAFSPRLDELAGQLERAAGALDGPELAMELAARARGVRDVAATLGALSRDELPGQVRWVETSPTGGVSVHSAPVDVGPPLREVLWKRHACVVLTSATLCTGRPPSFDYVRGRLGLEDAQGAAIGSPFHYDLQARLRVRTDVPDPGRDPAGYERALPGAILDGVRASRGGAFVLFTSVAAMRRAAAALREVLEADGLRVLVQGEDLERPALLDAFREGNAVLFGVASFWQGVDVPGDALRHVIIARLPFEVPTHPVQQARARQVREAGGDPFRDLSLPSAALRLKQGFGRLIRHTRDEGTVTILDPRLVTRSYGRFLLESLPECPVEMVGLED